MRRNHIGHAECDAVPLVVRGFITLRLSHSSRTLSPRRPDSSPGPVPVTPLTLEEVDGYLTTMMPRAVRIRVLTSKVSQIYLVAAVWEPTVTLLSSSCLPCQFSGATALPISLDHRPRRRNSNNKIIMIATTENPCPCPSCARGVVLTSSFLMKS